MNKSEFTNIHMHTEYSFLDGFSRVWDDAAKTPGPLIKRLKEIGHTQCAITDHGSTAGWCRFSKAMGKLEMRPILGVEGYYCNNCNVKGLTEEDKLIATRGIVSVKDKKSAIKKYEKKKGLDKRAHFVCLAMNQDGVYEILKTMSIAATEGFYHRPRWDFSLIKEMKNCIFGTACAGGILNYYLNKLHTIYKDKYDNVTIYEKAREYALREAEKWKKELGDRFYIELQPIDWEVQASYNTFCVGIAKELDIPCYLANDSHYVTSDEWEVHDVLLAIQSAYGDHNKMALNDPNRLRYDMHDLYVKSRLEMVESFKKHNNGYSDDFINEMLDNTNVIAERCNGVINKKKMIIPNITIPEGYQQKDYLKKLVQIGWKKKVIPYVDKEKWPEYKDRIKEELTQIIKQGFTPYFILCNYLMKWVDDNDIARGPARGSSCGSLVAYLLNITMIDPIPHKLLFSRFIDPNRTDFPDVDMDFEDKRRREVVEYFVDTYGKNNVAILGNNMSYKPKMTLKDIARLYHVPLNETQEVCNLVIERSGADSRLSFCLEDTFKQFEFAAEYAKKYPKVVEFSKKMEGLTKSQGVHAAGVIIADGDIRKYTALRYDKRQKEFLVSTIDKYDAEDLGILKMDVLGLNTMSILSEARKLVQERYGIKVDLEDLCKDVTYKGGDEKVYNAFAKGETVGIFQFATPGLTRLAAQVGIDRFSEIGDCTALHRPGPIHSGAMNQYPGLKKGKIKKDVSYHKIVAEETSDTYGLVIYQEQVMQIVRRLGDFNWAQTNEIRKVMSKSGGAEYFMLHYWPVFKEGCAKKGLDEKTSLKIFKRIMSFGCLEINTTLITCREKNYNGGMYNTIHKTLADLIAWSAIGKEFEVKVWNELELRYEFVKARAFVTGVKDVWEVTTISIGGATITSSKKLLCTMEHKFRTEKDEYNHSCFYQLKELKIGDNIFQDSSIGHIRLVKIKDIKYVGKVLTGDIDVIGAGSKSYLRNYLANDINVHNSWAFNRSTSKDTLILNTCPNKYSKKWVTIEELYKYGGYAPNKMGKPSSKYLKMKTLCMDSDGRLRPARIENVFKHGKQRLYEIITESGKSIKITKAHKLMGIDENGNDTFFYGCDIKKGTMLYINGGYEKTGYKSTKNKPFKYGRHIEADEFKNEMLGKPCQRCGKDYVPFDSFKGNFTVHNSIKSAPESILRWLCNSCHKIEDYELGNRKTQWSKGYPVHIEKVVSKRYVGVEETYDIEMQDSSRPTFIANDFVSHNSHSVAYAFVSYFCMWFKVNYPIEYCTAYLNMISGGEDRENKIKQMVREIDRLGIKLSEPDINLSKDKFVISGDRIVSSLSNVKQVGVKAVQAVIEGQPYSDFIDFMKRVDKRKCNKRSVENLIKCGAFSSFNYDNIKLIEKLPDILKNIKSGSEKKAKIAEQMLEECKDFAGDNSSQQLVEMKQAVSPIYVGKHIIHYYSDVVDTLADHIKITKLVDIEQDEGEQAKSNLDRKKIDVYLMGSFGKPDLKRLSQEVKELIDKGEERRYALANLEDDTDFIVLSFREMVYEMYEQRLFDFVNKVMLVKGTVNKGWKKCYVDKVYEMDKLREYIKKGRKPFEFDLDYLLEHPLDRYFKKYGGAKAIKKKYGCVDLNTLKKVDFSVDIWVMGVVNYIQSMKIKKADSKYLGQEMYWVFFEDETFQGSFFIHPNDSRYERMKKDIFEMYKIHTPFILRVQRDLKFTPDKIDLKQVNMSIDKRLKWKDCILMPFKFKK